MPVLIHRRGFLFPARAGVIPLAAKKGGGLRSVPRTRGGDPDGCGSDREGAGCSPHARG